MLAKHEMNIMSMDTRIYNPGTIEDQVESTVFHPFAARSLSFTGLSLFSVTSCCPPPLPPPPPALCRVPPIISARPLRCRCEDNLQSPAIPGRFGMCLPVMSAAQCRGQSALAPLWVARQLKLMVRRTLNPLATLCSPLPRVRSPTMPESFSCSKQATAAAGKLQLQAAAARLSV